MTHHVPPVPYQGSPLTNHLMIPADMSLVAWLEDINGNKVGSPTLSANGLQKVFLYFTADNMSKIDANDISVTADVIVKTVSFFEPDPSDPDNPKAKGASPLDLFPANDNTVRNTYTHHFAFGPFTLKVPSGGPLPQPKTNIRTGFLGEIGIFLPLNSAWDAGEGPGNLVVNLSAEVHLENIKTVSIPIKVVHHGLS